MDGIGSVAEMTGGDTSELQGWRARRAVPPTAFQPLSISRSRVRLEFGTAPMSLDRQRYRIAFAKRRRYARRGSTKGGSGSFAMLHPVTQISRIYRKRFGFALFGTVPQRTNRPPAAFVALLSHPANPNAVDQLFHVTFDATSGDH